MKSRMPIIAIALVSGLTAAYLSSWREAVPAPRPVVETEIVPAAEVLVAATDLRLGTKLSEGQLKWLPWPADGLGSGMIVRGKTPNGLTQTVGALGRDTFGPEQPIKKDNIAPT